MVCDERGFVKTGTDIAPLELVKAGWSLDRMPSRFETSWPRIYPVGDVRQGSGKRVASSVGAGWGVVRDIHQALAGIAAAAQSCNPGQGRDYALALCCTAAPQALPGMTVTV